MSLALIKAPYSIPHVYISPLQHSTCLYPQVHALGVGCIRDSWSDESIDGDRELPTEGLDISDILDGCDTQLSALRELLSSFSPVLVDKGVQTECSMPPNVPIVMQYIPCRSTVEFQNKCDELLLSATHTVESFDIATPRSLSKPTTEICKNC